jgi:serine/threonine-protein kinase RsbT
MTARLGEQRPTETHDVATDADVVRVRQAVRTQAVAASLSLIDQTKLVTATSELARNTVTYGKGGTAVIEHVTKMNRAGIRVTFTDSGPGIPDLEKALTDGWTSGTGMGLGLSGARRLVDDFEVTSAPGDGTTVCITKWAR